MLAALLTAAALSTSAAVPVTGGSNAERVIVREALGALDRGAVSSAHIDPNHYLVLGPSSLRDPGAAYGRAEWEAQALVATVAARFAAAGDRLVGYRIMGNCGHNTSCGSGGTLSAADSPAIGSRGARRLRAIVVASARASGLAVRVAQVLPIGGVLSVVVRLREDQLLDAKLPAARRRGRRSSSTSRTDSARSPSTGRSASSAARALRGRAIAAACSPTAGRCSCRR